MTVEEKVGKTLEELGVSDAAGVEKLFTEVRAAMAAQRQEFRGTVGEAEAKALRDRWLARKNGILASIDEHWLKPASKELKPVVGRDFNRLRQEATAEILGEADLLEAAAERLAPRMAAPDLTLPGYRRPLGSIHPV